MIEREQGEPKYRFLETATVWPFNGSVEPIGTMNIYRQMNAYVAENPSKRDVLAIVFRVGNGYVCAGAESARRLGYPTNEIETL